MKSFLEIIGKINFKEGIRRIVLFLISVGVILAFSIKFNEGFLDKDIFYQNTFLITSNQEKYLFHEFDNMQIDSANLDIPHRSSYNYSCEPLKRYCYNKDFPNQKIIEGDLIDYEAKVEMPSLYKMIALSLLGFLMIIINALIVWFVYLLIEKVFIWIIKGFKEN